MTTKPITLNLDRSEFELLLRSINRYWSDAHHAEDLALEERLDVLAENLEEQKLTSIMNNRGI